MDEFDIITWIRERTAAHDSVPVGPGDDCAQISCRGRDIAVSTDAVVEGIHFAPDADPFRIGWKAAASSLSDIAAAGCEPAAVLVASQIPKGRSGSFLKELFRGIEEVCALFTVPVAGGDLSASMGGVCITVTSIGFVPSEGMILRSGACEGDAVFVTGALGDSGSGHHLDFVPRIREALCLRDICAPTAMIDISDGLFSELKHISEESCIGIEVDLDRIPFSASLQEKCPGRSKEALVHALCDGEDYELLFTVPDEDRKRLPDAWNIDTPLTCIGTCVGKGGPVGFISGTVSVIPEELKTFSHEF